MQQLAEQISETEQRYPDSLLIILGDFNKANLSRELPKYRQHVTCPTRDSNILDHCYTIIKDAYHSVPWAALGLSNHCLVHLIPTYRHKFKSSKPVLRTVKGVVDCFFSRLDCVYGVQSSMCSCLFFLKTHYFSHNLPLFHTSLSLL